MYRRRERAGREARNEEGSWGERDVVGVVWRPGLCSLLHERWVRNHTAGQASRGTLWRSPFLSESKEVSMRQEFAGQACFRLPPAERTTNHGRINDARALRVESAIRHRSLETWIFRPRMSVPKPHACPAKPGQAWHTTRYSSAAGGVCRAHAREQRDAPPCCAARSCPGTGHAPCRRILRSPTGSWASRHREKSFQPTEPTQNQTAPVSE
jgi:hypothetical protein